ncbi:MAG: serpin family protein [Oscillospiraceae bacterium]|nr:serpin family protein [Oscillospiraceae bacterium]MBP3520527.1 serpin family protein [Oscillospiraceae bacterium]
MKKLIIATLALSLLMGCMAGYTPRIPIETPATNEDDGGDILPIPPQPVLEKVTPNGLVLRLLELEKEKAPGGSVILSPLSIEMALAMASNGAAGEAKEAMETLLGLNAEQLNSLLGPYLLKEDNTLSIANSMWFNESMKDLVKADFQETLRTVYAAGEGSFTPGSQADADAINGWVKEKTHDKIDSIITPDGLTEDTLALLINALYFNGKWADPFEEWQVTDETFRAPSGDQQARLMDGWEGTYFENEWGTGFAKDYEDGYEFIGLLPKTEGAVDLSALDIDEILATRTGAYDVHIKIPKFELEYSTSLVDTLSGLGLGSLFAPGSLNGMLTDEALENDWNAWVSDVLHKTYMKMYEEGTEAAAVTAVIVECATAAMPVERETKEVFLDRPFAFLIRDTQSGQVVFCGIISSVEK